MKERDPCKDCGQWSIRSSMCCWTDTTGMTRQTTSNRWVVNTTGMARPNAWQIIIAMGIGRQHQDVNDAQEKIVGNREHLLSGDDRCSGEGQCYGEDQRYGED